MKKVQELMNSYQDTQDASVFGQIRELLQTEEGLFSVVARITNNFYMGVANGKPAALLFTSREYADAFVKEMKNVGVQVKSLEIRPEQRIAFFNDLYRSGFEAVLLDKDQEALAMSLFSIIEKPQIDSGVVVNPNLMHAAIRFYQGIASQHMMKEMQDWVCKELYNARFVYPETSAHYSIVAALTDGKGKKYIPVFTDMIEFGKFDKQHNYVAKTLRFRDLKKVLGNASGIVVNPFGFGLKLEPEKLERIEKENQTLKIVK